MSSWGRRRSQGHSNDQTGLGPVERQRDWSRVAGWVFTFVGRIVLVLGAISVILAVGFYEEDGHSVNDGNSTLSNPSGAEVFHADAGVLWGMVIGGLIVAGIGSSTIVLGRRHLAPSAKELLARDRRQPVIYLRSFRADKMMSSRKIQNDISELLKVRPSLEQDLILTLNAIGPVVALGEPGEKVPPLGAARDYVDDTVWRERVLDWVHRAAMLVLLVGQTDSFFWEVEQVARLVDHRRLIFILPDDVALYARFRQRFEEHFKVALPETCDGMTAAKFGPGIWGILAIGSEGTWSIKRLVRVKGSGLILWRATLQAAEALRVASAGVGS